MEIISQYEEQLKKYKEELHIYKRREEANQKTSKAEEARKGIRGQGSTDQLSWTSWDQDIISSIFNKILVADNIKQADPDTNLTPPPQQAVPSATSPGVQLSPAPPQLPHVTNLPQSSLPPTRPSVPVVSQAPSPREMQNHMPRLPGQGIIRQPTSQYEFALNQMKNRNVSYQFINYDSFVG